MQIKKKSDQFFQKFFYVVHPIFLLIFYDKSFLVIKVKLFIKTPIVVHIGDGIINIHFRMMMLQI